jgi:hypothetical protein
VIQIENHINRLRRKASKVRANATGDRYAARHAELAGTAGVAFERLRPPEGADWNNMLVKGRGP